MTCENKDAILEIRSDIREIKEDLATHMSRTAANEARLELMESFVINQSKENQQLVMQMGEQLIKQAGDQAGQSNKQLKITLSLFTAISILIAALWKISQ